MYTRNILTAHAGHAMSLERLHDFINKRPPATGTIRGKLVAEVTQLGVTVAQVFFDGAFLRLVDKETVLRSWLCSPLGLESHLKQLERKLTAYNSQQN